MSDGPTILEVWAIHEWDGGERTNFSFYTNNESLAKTWKEQHPNDFVAPQVLVIFETLAQRDAHRTLFLRQRAWDKLDPVERQALGMIERP